MQFDVHITGPDDRGWYAAEALLEGSNIGTAEARPEPEYPGSVYVSHVSVDSAHQQQGVATDLLLMLVDRIDQTKGVDYPVTGRAATLTGRLLLDAFERIRPGRITVMTD